MRLQLERLLLLQASLVWATAAGLQYTAEFGARASSGGSLQENEDTRYDDDNNSQTLYLPAKVRRANKGAGGGPLPVDRRRPPPLAGRKSNNTHQMPTYHIIGAEPIARARDYSSTGSGQTAAAALQKQLELSSPGENEVDFSNELLNLTARAENSKRPPSYQQHKLPRASPRLKLASSNASELAIRDHNYTVNLLLNMLLLANRKCADKHKESLARLRELSTLGPAEAGFKSTRARAEIFDDEDLIENSSRLNATSPPPVANTKRRASGDQLFGSTSALEAQRDNPDKPETGQPEKKPASAASKRRAKSDRKSAEGDFNRVRPGGYEKRDEERLSASQDMSHNSAVRFPSPLELLGLQQPEPEMDLLRNHKPIVAHDLLEVHQRHHNGHQLARDNAPSGEPHYGSPMAHHHQRHHPMERIRPENLFVSRPNFERKSHPFEHYLQGGPALGEPSPFQVQGLSQAVDREPPSLLLGPFSGGEQLNKPPVSLNNHLQTLVGNELELQNQPPGDNANNLNAHPIHQMLMAAKNQQAAALAYENRRLQHEQELQKQSEDIRRKHEQQVERQRQEAVKAQQQQQQEEEEQKKRKEQQEVSTNNETGKEEPNQTEQHQGKEEGQENNGGENNDQEEPESEQGQQNEQQQKEQEDDPEMKNLKSFADTDFTDLFPPGILSQEEIKEMRKQQEEQKKKEAEEES